MTTHSQNTATCAPGGSAGASIPPEVPARKLRVLDLFSGIGGFSLGLERTGGFETVAFCEIEDFPRRVLKKHWPEVPCYEDVRKLKGSDIGAADVICGGFPCQDISSAGKKAGIDGIKSSLWREYSRLIGEIRPRYVVVENSSELLNRGLGIVLGDLAARGYDAEWQCISAAVLGAPHGRDRCWIVAYSNNQGKSGCAINDEARRLSETSENDAAYTQSRERKMGRVMARIGRVWKSVAWDGLWETENSPIGMGVDDGLPNRMDRLRGLGNAVVPQIPEMIGYAILEAEQDFTAPGLNEPRIDARRAACAVSQPVNCLSVETSPSPSGGGLLTAMKKASAVDPRN